MRLVIWNCCNGLDQKRAEGLDGLKPDVAVIPEAGQMLTWPLGIVPEPSGVEWHGETERKGLAVLTFGDWSVKLADEPARVPWVLPVDISGPASFRLLAIWTVQRPEWPDYPNQVHQAIEAYGPELADGTTVLAGDFNCSPQTQDNRQHLVNVTTLEGLGMRSAFHATHDTAPGTDEPGTLFWQWRQDQPFHCDFGFVPESWTKGLQVEVGSFDDWVASRLSDHVPVIIDIELPSS